VNVEFKSSFAKDLKNIDKPLAQRLRRVIEEIEAAKSLSEIPNLKRIRGRSNYYRVRIGDYRVGLIVDGETVEFVRFLNRREIYRYFP
jgi:mRNA interferase RelE/StbE